MIYRTLGKIPELAQRMLDALVIEGHLTTSELGLKIEHQDNIPCVPQKWKGDKHWYKRSENGIGNCSICQSDTLGDGNHFIKIGERSFDLTPEKVTQVAMTDFHRYIGNGKSIEANIEAICKEHLGICEDTKQWIKDLRQALSEYGHDDVLESFYEWSRSVGVFVGKRPVNAYLKNIESHISSLRKPKVTNPALERATQKIAYITDNKVFFTGEYRLRLALLLKDYGDDVVLQAFADFYQDVEDKNISWASRNFLERAETMISIIQRKRSEVAAQEALIAAQYAQAKDSVEDVEED